MMSRFVSSRTTALPVLLRRLSGNPMFLHVGPSGDCWTGASIYAAKHLQPDYVKSIPLPPQLCVESLLERLEEDHKLAQHVYDDGKLPEQLIEEMCAD